MPDTGSTSPTTNLRPTAVFAGPCSFEGDVIRLVEFEGGGGGVQVWDSSSRVWKDGFGFSFMDPAMRPPLSASELAARGVPDDGLPRKALDAD